ncbi:MAG: LCP family protein [Acidimicrobiia bacterium]|nr:LCP family protein [Acidimicrobiia bacterium]
MSEPPQHRIKPEPKKDLTARELNRAARRDSRSRARRKILLATLVAFALIVASVTISYLRLQSEEVGPDAVVIESDAGASALVVIEDAGLPKAILLVGASADQASRLVTIPGSLLAIAPGFGEYTLEEAYTIGGIDLLSLTITNLLGARIDDTFTHTRDEFTALFDEPLEISIIRPFVTEDAEGNQKVAAGEGLQPRTPEMIGTLLTDKGVDNDLDYLFRQGEVWTSVFDTVGGSKRLTDQFVAGGTTAGIAALTGASQDDGLIVSSLPVVRVNTLSTGAERYSLDVADAAVFVDQAVPYLAIGEAPRLVIEILNGKGGVGITQPVAKTFVLAGYRVLKTDNAGTLNYPSTQVIAQGRDRRDAAVAAQALLGYGEVVLEVRQPSGVVDLTIILGEDAP